jgi:hypothetical protein
MSTTQNRPKLDLVLTVITGVIALAVTVFAVAAATDMFLP